MCPIMNIIKTMRPYAILFIISLRFQLYLQQILRLIWIDLPSERFHDLSYKKSYSGLFSSLVLFYDSRIVSNCLLYYCDDLIVV